MYMYPDNLKAKATLWLWELKDIGIIGIGLLISVFALSQIGFMPPIVITAVYAFLTIVEIEMLCLNSKENFDDNKQYLKKRMEIEKNPVIRQLLQQDSSNLDRMQVQMATAREFLIIIRLKDQKESNMFPYLSRMEKSLKDQGFAARRADNADIKRLLGVYYEQNVTTEKYEDYDGERWVVLGDM